MDGRVVGVLTEALLKNERAVLFLVGDRAKDQVVNLCHVRERIAGTNARERRGRIVWCYKKELGFTTHKLKKIKQIQKRIARGNYDKEIEDPFWLYQQNNDITYCRYRDSSRLLGGTCDVLILQDFNALTPNLLCRTIETVKGGGLILFLLASTSSLEQLYNITFDIHRDIRGASGAPSIVTQVEPRFCKRFVLSLTQCNNCLFLDDELNILPLSSSQLAAIPETALPSAEMVAAATVDPELAALRLRFGAETKIRKLLEICATFDQATAVVALTNAFSDAKGVVALTAGRGRGKSAALGMAAGLALAEAAHNCSREIILTAPSPDNVATVFEFAIKVLQIFGFEENTDFIAQLLDVDSLEEEAAYFYRQNPNLRRATASLTLSLPSPPTDPTSSTPGQAPETVGQKLTNRLIYRFPKDVADEIADCAGSRDSDEHSESGGGEEAGGAGNAEGEFRRKTLIVDEAASLSSQSLSALRPHQWRLALISSTVDGYEGSGASLALNLLSTLEPERSLTLSSPIRYASEDPVEKWLRGLLCLNSCQPHSIARFLSLADTVKDVPDAVSLEVFCVNKDTLFSYNPTSETFLRAISTLFQSSHRRNSPDELMKLSDSAKRYLFVQLARVRTLAGRDSEVSPARSELAVVGAAEVTFEDHLLGQSLAASSSDASEASSAHEALLEESMTWQIDHFYPGSDFYRLRGAKITRMAIHTKYRRRGAASVLLKFIYDWLATARIATTQTQEVSGTDKDKEGKSETNTPIKEAKPQKSESGDEASKKIQKSLLLPLLDCAKPLSAEYLGAAFDLEESALSFWSRQSLLPVYVSHKVNDFTGLNSAIFLRKVDVKKPTMHWEPKAFCANFLPRFVSSLTGPFARLPTALSATLILFCHQRVSEPMQLPGPMATEGDDVGSGTPLESEAASVTEACWEREASWVGEAPWAGDIFMPSRDRLEAAAAALRSLQKISGGDLSAVERMKSQKLMPFIDVWLGIALVVLRNPGLEWFQKRALAFDRHMVETLVRIGFGRTDTIKLVDEELGVLMRLSRSLACFHTEGSKKRKSHEGVGLETLSPSNQSTDASTLGAKETSASTVNRKKSRQAKPIDKPKRVRTK